MNDENIVDENENIENINGNNGSSIIAKRLSFGDVTASLRSTDLPAGIAEVFKAASSSEPTADTLKR